MDSQASASLTLALDVESSSVAPLNSHHIIAPGFRFHPTEHELVLYYLGRKVFGEPLYTDAVPEIDVYKMEPYEIPGKVRGDIEWFFFSKLDKKYETGVRVNRSTKLGFWKVTGPEYKIKYGSRVIGEKRFLVYYDGHSKMGKRTDWVLHEYRLTDATLPVVQGKEIYAVYRLFWKGNSDPISGGPAPADAVEGGEQVHGDDVAPASAAFQVVEELGPDGKNTETTPADEAPEAAPNALALVIHNEAPSETLDLVTHFYGKRPYEHSKGTSSAREGTRACPVKRPRLAEPDSPRNLSPRGQEPNSSNSAAGAIPSLTLSLACPASETAPEQQEQRLIVAPQPVPRQAVKPPRTTSVQILPKIRLTIERSGKRGTSTNSDAATSSPASREATADNKCSNLAKDSLNHREER